MSCATCIEPKPHFLQELIDSLLVIEIKLLVQELIAFFPGTVLDYSDEQKQINVTRPTANKTIRTAVIPKDRDQIRGVVIHYRGVGRYPNYYDHTSTRDLALSYAKSIKMSEPTAEALYRAVDITQRLSSLFKMSFRNLANMPGLTQKEQSLLASIEHLIGMDQLL